MLFGDYNGNKFVNLFRVHDDTDYFLSGGSRARDDVLKDVKTATAIVSPKSNSGSLSYISTKLGNLQVMKTWLHHLPGQVKRSSANVNIRILLGQMPYEPF